MKMRDLAEIPPWDWPPTASVSILEVLGDREAPSDERQLAVELAGDLVVMNDDLAGAFTYPDQVAAAMQDMR